MNNVISKRRKEKIKRHALIDLSISLVLAGLVYVLSHSVAAALLIGVVCFLYSLNDLYQIYNDRRPD